MKSLCLLCLILASTGAASAAPAPAHTLANLTLDQAFALADQLQPQLAEATALVQAAEGRAQQAGAFPNPELIVGAQQIPLSRSDADEREYLAGVAQPIPLGRRLPRAREAERLNREAQARGLEVKRSEIHRRIHAAFATALYQEHARQTQARILDDAAKAVATTAARLQAGDALPDDLARAEIQQTRARLEFQRTQSLHQRSLLSLATAIGDPGLPVTSLAGSLEGTFEIPTLEDLAATLSTQPANALAEAELRALTARVSLAEAERIPDVRVEALYHRLEASRADTLDLGLSLPLALFNRNQGRIREARADVAAAQARSEMTRNEVEARLRTAHLQLTSSLATSRTLRTDVLSRSDTVLRVAEARYAAGDLSLAELLPLRREWAETQLDYLESLREVMLAWAELRTFSAHR